MVRYRDTLWCDGCGVEIRWKPIVKGQRYYCCLRCFNGEVCDCSNDLEDYPTTSRQIPSLTPNLPLIENG